MSDIKEIYKSLVSQIENINARVNSLTNQVNVLKSQVDRTIPEKIKALKKQLADIDEYEARIDKIRIGAERHVHTKNNIDESPRPINFNRLRNWSKMIDPDLSDDPYAQRVMIMCRCNLAFLAEKREEYVKMLARIKSVDTKDAEKELDQLEAELDDEWKKYDELIASEEMAEFARALREANAKWIYDKYPTSYVSKKKDSELMAMGCMAMELPLPTIKRNLASGVINGVDSLSTKLYDETTGCVWFPLELEANKEQTVLVSYSSSVDTKCIEQGLQSMLFRTINDSETGTHRILFMDALHYNTSILGPMKVFEDTVVMKRLPRNPENITEQLKELIAEFSDYDEVLGMVDSVAEYNNLSKSSKAEENADDEEEDKSNKKAKKKKESIGKDKLDRTTLFLVGYPTAFPKDAIECVQRILVNSERYGVTIVAVDTFTEKSGVSYKGIPEYIANRAWRIVMNQSSYTVQEGEDGAVQGYKWYPAPKEVSSKYANDIKKLLEERASIGNVYTRHVDLVNREPYTRRNKEIEVKVAVDGRDLPDTINFKNENFAHFLMGASGSGKSTLLHTIITGIIRNYHPDDVELWLADFKMSEFAQYIDPMPPHIKYILLDESQELVYDLIDKLTEKMMERQKYFMVHRDDKKVENVPVTEYMPVIFVMLDEFSIMSQAVAESEVYRLKLQNLLAKGRALGIKFVFSSQTFKNGISGLTTTAKEQIQTRIAMKNSLEEITETLELTSNTKTEQVRGWMEALPPHYILMKYREGDQMKVKRLQVMYFEGDGEAAYEPQRQLIRNINSSMRKVSENEYNTGIETYVDKHPVIVDGNSFKKYDQSVIDECIKAYKSANEGNLLGDEMYLTFGSPRLMVESKLTTMTNESRENILLVARNNEQPLAMSIILSAMKGIKAQGLEVEVWAYERSRMYVANKSLFTTGEYTVVEGIDGICNRIKAIKQSIVNREISNRMVILVGMDRICADFELIEGSSSGSTSISSVLNVKREKPKVLVDRDRSAKNGAAVLSAKDEARRQFALAWPDEQKNIENRLKEEGKSEEEIAEIVKTERKAFANKLLAQIEAQQAAENNNSEDSEKIPELNVQTADSNDGSEAGNEKENSTKESDAESTEQTEEKDGAYAALEDFVYIVKQGSRMGTHFMLTISDLADLKQCGVRADLFRHRMSFQMSVDDSRNMFGSRVASTLPEHICQYDDSFEKYSFRPYLHQGISWDGWTVDESGKVINPMTGDL